MAESSGESRPYPIGSIWRPKVGHPGRSSSLSPSRMRGGQSQTQGRPAGLIPVGVRGDFTVYRTREQLEASLEPVDGDSDGEPAKKTAKPDARSRSASPEAIPVPEKICNNCPKAPNVDTVSPGIYGLEGRRFNYFLEDEAKDIQGRFSMFFVNNNQLLRLIAEDRKWLMSPPAQDLKCHATFMASENTFIIVCSLIKYGLCRDFLEVAKIPLRKGITHICWQPEMDIGVKGNGLGPVRRRFELRPAAPDIWTAQQLARQGPYRREFDGYWLEERTEDPRMISRVIKVSPRFRPETVWYDHVAVLHRLEVVANSWNADCLANLMTADRVKGCHCFYKQLKLERLFRPVWPALQTPRGLEYFYRGVNAASHPASEFD